MRIAMVSMAVLAGAVHVMFFFVESLWWTTPKVRERFRQTPEQAAQTQVLAFNQGFYNLFLAIGTFAGLALGFAGQPHLGLMLVAWNCLTMVAAGIVLASSAPEMRRGAMVQIAPPLLFLVLAAVNAVR